MTVQKMISLPIELAEAIPNITEHDRTTFSGFVQKSIKKRARELEEKVAKRRGK
jgi:hypothetical protein